MHAQSRPDITQPPSTAELEAAAYAALGLPREEEGSAHGPSHFLGTIIIERNDVALDAVVYLWTLRVHAALHVLRTKAPADWRQNPSAYTFSPAQMKCNFLRFDEYLDEVK